MLQLLSVTEVREHIFLVTFDSDGQTFEYEFTWTPPVPPDVAGHVDYPPRVDYDLADYEAEELKDKPGGALWVPALSTVIDIIHRLAAGEDVDFPFVLDER